ncbi:MAG: HgcAB-associated protein [Candidatus Bipolaricaulis sp.]|nr:HgcAB-associated protein [Candidatus Bipolaricaulis sp.]
MPKNGTQRVGVCGTGCSVQALVRIDDRGQMVLPKDVRDKAGLRGGDKLALTTVEKDGRVCCLVLTRADDLGATVRTMLEASTADEGEEE